MPDGLEHDGGLPAHQAIPDTYVTAHDLSDLLSSASLKQLLAWSREPLFLPRVPSDPNCGKNWNRFDEKALVGFLQDRDADVPFTATTERTRRSYRPAKKIEPEQGR